MGQGGQALWCQAGLIRELGPQCSVDFDTQVSLLAPLAGVKQMGRAKVVSVSDVLAEAGTNVHGNCFKAVLHQVLESETSLFSVSPGEKLAAHLHARTWDLFFVVSGLGEIRYRGKDGSDTVPMPARAFCAIPPGYEHEVCNLSATEPFNFLLIHAPWQGYDFVRTQE
jgi:mannose-6-phosphate isomerase-like protein (cupin superfamily)